jgi:hypothetical protein
VTVARKSAICREPDRRASVGNEVWNREEYAMWLALAAITLVAATGFYVLALGIQRYEH